MLLVLTTTLKSLRPACENGICREASNLQVALFYTSLYTIAVGSGAVKPNMSTFGADQFDDFRHEEKEQKVSFFNWWAFNGACGSLMATLFVVYIQEKNGWGLAYSLSAIGFLLSSIIFFWGSPVYRHKSRQARSPSMNFIRVPLVAFRNRKLQLPCNPSELHEFQLNYYISSGARKIHHTSHFRFALHNSVLAFPWKTEIDEWFVGFLKEPWMLKLKLFRVKAHEWFLYYFSNIVSHVKAHRTWSLNHT